MLLFLFRMCVTAKLEHHPSKMKEEFRFRAMLQNFNNVTFDSNDILVI